MVGTFARTVAISTLAGVLFLFLIFFVRQEFWGWRLALYGALGGFAAPLFCRFLDSTIGGWTRRRGFLPDRIVRVVLYFIGGCAALLSSTALLSGVGLMPFRLGGGDLRMAVLISGGVAIVLGLLFYSFDAMGKRLRESVERIKEQEFAEKELELARSIQRRLLPPPDLSGEGYRIAARNLPARFVAGDFYDVFHLADGALGVVVADVSGKGMGASLIMASVKAVLPLVAEGRRAAETLTELNRRLSSELGIREFVALAYARFEPGSGVLELSNAGLPDPYKLVPNARPEALEVPGARLPLGARANIVYESLTVSLRPGDRILLLTDGLPEAPTASGDPLGYEALADLLRPGKETPAELVDRLFASVRQATRPALEDDWTALVLQAEGSGG